MVIRRLLATLLAAMLPFAYLGAQQIYDIHTLVDLDEQGITVAIEADGMHLLNVAGCVALPE